MKDKNEHLILSLIIYLVKFKHFLVSGSSLAIPLPIIASNPHFLDADKIIQNAVEGLAPDETLHRSYMDLEPTTGSTSFKN